MPTPELPAIARLWPGAPVSNGTFSLGKVGDLFFVAGLVLAIPWIAAIVVPLLEPMALRIDPHDYWLMPTAHQLASLVLALAAMRALSTRTWSEWGFNLQRAGLGLLLALGFAIVTTPALYLLMEHQATPTTPISAWEIVVVLLTHFLIIGFTQEVLFRGFAMTMLSAHRPVAAGLWATVIFTLAHLKFDSSQFWRPELAFAFGFGLLYAIMFHRTKSLLGPAVAHGYSNTIYVAMLLLKHGFA
jgi:membrane protease YdiL (CAAX protease family)